MLLAVSQDAISEISSLVVALSTLGGVITTVIVTVKTHGGVKRNNDSLEIIKKNGNGNGNGGGEPHA